jgi:hypothetical protein
MPFVIGSTSADNGSFGLFEQRAVVSVDLAGLGMESPVMVAGQSPPSL